MRWQRIKKSYNESINHRNEAFSAKGPRAFFAGEHDAISVRVPGGLIVRRKLNERVLCESARLTPY